MFSSPEVTLAADELFAVVAAADDCKYEKFRNITLVITVTSLLQLYGKFMNDYNREKCALKFSRTHTNIMERRTFV